MSAPSRQRGLAAVMAILVVALAASTAIYLLWQHTVMTRQLENVMVRAQIREIARAGTAWAGAILSADDPKIDHLNEPWAQKLPPIQVEQATLEGQMTDEQSKFNLNNLVGANGQPSEPDVQAFTMLLTSLGLDTSLAGALIDWIDPDQTVTSPGGAEDSYYLSRDPPYRAGNARIQSLGELRLIRGFTQQAIDKLTPYVTALDDTGLKLNVNTMTPDMLAKFVPEVAPNAVVEARRRAPFASRDEFLKLLTDKGQDRLRNLIGVNTGYFSARATVTQGRTSITYRAILKRSSTTGTASWPQVQVLSEEPM